MLADFQNPCRWICSKAIVKYPSAPQMRRYTTLWNVCAKKWLCSRAEWGELPCGTQPFDTVAEKYSSNDVSTVLLTDKKIFNVVTPKNPENQSPTLRNCSTKKKDIATQMLAQTMNVQTVADGISRRVTSGRETQVWYLSIMEWRQLTAVVLTWCSDYNSYCPKCVRHQASSSSFSRTVPGTHGAWGSQLSYR